MVLAAKGLDDPHSVPYDTCAGKAVYEHVLLKYSNPLLVVFRTLAWKLRFFLSSLPFTQLNVCGPMSTSYSLGLELSHSFSGMTGNLRGSSGSSSSSFSCFHLSHYGKKFHVQEMDSVVGPSSSNIPITPSGCHIWQVMGSLLSQNMCQHPTQAPKPCIPRLLLPPPPAPPHPLSTFFSVDIHIFLSRKIVLLLCLTLNS